MDLVLEEGHALIRLREYLYDAITTKNLVAVYLEHRYY